APYREYRLWRPCTAYRLGHETRQVWCLPGLSAETACIATDRRHPCRRPRGGSKHNDDKVQNARVETQAAHCLHEAPDACARSFVGSDWVESRSRLRE